MPAQIGVTARTSKTEAQVLQPHAALDLAACREVRENLFWLAAAVYGCERITHCKT